MTQTPATLAPSVDREREAARATAVAANLYIQSLPFERRAQIRLRQAQAALARIQTARKGANSKEI